MSAYNFISKTNYKFVNITGPGDIVLLAPLPGFSISNPTVSINSGTIQVNTDAIGNSQNIDLSVETSIKLISVVHLYNPTDAYSKKNDYVASVSDAQSLALDTPLSFSITLGGWVSQLYDKYQNSKGYFILITLDAGNNVVHFSSTFTG